MVDQIVESMAPVLTPTEIPLEYPADILEWPWPRLIMTRSHALLFVKQQNGTLLCFEMQLTEFGSWNGYAVALIGEADEVSFIDVADFGPYYIIATNSRVFARNPTLDAESADRDVFGVNLCDELEAPRFQTCCNYKQQLIGGNISEWLELGTNGVVWSGIGRLEFDPVVDKTSGFSSLISKRSDGTVCTIQRILPMQEGVVVYTNHGNVALLDGFVDPSFTYGLIPLQNPYGILNGNHVAGDEYYHGFIDVNKDFWTLESPLAQGGKLTKRGYRSYISSLFETGTEVIVSYIPHERQFYISNGQHSLVVNEYGAFTAHQAVSGVAVGWNGEFYGTFRDFGDKQGRVTLDATDFGSRGLKTLDSVLIGCSSSPGTEIEVSSKWRTDLHREMQNFHFLPISPRGEARMCLSAMEYKIQVRFSSYYGSEIHNIAANVKFPDARFRRGVESGTYSTSS